MGESTFAYDVLAAKVKQAVDAGVQVFTHTNGDTAIHSQFQREDHLEDYVELGIMPSYFTNHAYFWERHTRDQRWPRQGGVH